MYVTRSISWMLCTNHDSNIVKGYLFLKNANLTLKWCGIIDDVFCENHMQEVL